jgi:hypothetical protein
MLHSQCWSKEEREAREMLSKIFAKTKSGYGYAGSLPLDMEDMVATLTFKTTPDILSKAFMYPPTDADVKAALVKLLDSAKGVKTPVVSGLQRLLTACILIKCKILSPNKSLTKNLVESALLAAARLTIEHMTSKVREGLQGLQSLTTLRPEGDNSYMIPSCRSIAGEEGTSRVGRRFGYDWFGDATTITVQDAVLFLSYQRDGKGSCELDGNKKGKYNVLWRNTFSLAQLVPFPFFLSLSLSLSSARTCSIRHSHFLVAVTFTIDGVLYCRFQKTHLKKQLSLSLSAQRPLHLSTLP